MPIREVQSKFAEPHAEAQVQYCASGRRASWARQGPSRAKGCVSSPEYAYPSHTSWIAMPIVMHSMSAILSFGSDERGATSSPRPKLSSFESAHVERTPPNRVQYANRLF